MPRAGGTAVQKNDALVFDLGRAGRDRARGDVFFHRSVDSIHVSTLVARLGERARLTSFALVTGAGLLRRQGFLRFEGVHAKASLAGVSLLRGRQHADTTLVVHHVAPHCESREFFRHILDGEATGVFQGKVVVAPGAQKTDGVMKSQAILLSEDATMNNKPELEIFADDVVCGHGATCGELDADQVFYVQSRGLPRPEAEALLLEAFAAAAIDRVDERAAARHAARQDTGVARRAEFLMDTQAAALDVMKLREDFPILAERPYGKPLVYLDNAASAQKPKVVIDRLVHAYEHEYANVHRGLHYLANAATEAYEAARETVRGFLNAASAEEIVFTRSATRIDQSRRRVLRSRPYRRRRRDRALRSWNIIPISCPGISTASARARC